MKYQALKVLCGDYGEHETRAVIHPGTVFEKPDYLISQYAELERLGLIQRIVDRPKFDRKAYTVYQRPAVEAPETKPEEPEAPAPQLEIVESHVENKFRKRRFRR